MFFVDTITMTMGVLYALDPSCKRLFMVMTHVSNIRKPFMQNHVKNWILINNGKKNTRIFACHVKIVKAVNALG